MLILLALAASAQTWELELVESGTTNYVHRWPSLVPEDKTDFRMSLLDSQPETYEQDFGWRPIPWGKCSVEGNSLSICAPYQGRGNATLLYSGLWDHFSDPETKPPRAYLVGGTSSWIPAPGYSFWHEYVFGGWGASPTEPIKAQQRSRSYLGAGGETLQGLSHMEAVQTGTHEWVLFGGYPAVGSRWTLPVPRYASTRMTPASNTQRWTTKNTFNNPIFEPILFSTQGGPGWGFGRWSKYMVVQGNARRYHTAIKVAQEHPYVVLPPIVFGGLTGDTAYFPGDINGGREYRLYEFGANLSAWSYAFGDFVGVRLRKWDNTNASETAAAEGMGAAARVCARDDVGREDLLTGFYVFTNGKQSQLIDSEYWIPASAPLQFGDALASPWLPTGGAQQHLGAALSHGRDLGTVLIFGGQGTRNITEFDCTLATTPEVAVREVGELASDRSFGAVQPFTWYDAEDMPQDCYMVVGGSSVYPEGDLTPNPVLSTTDPHDQLWASAPGMGDGPGVVGDFLNTYEVYCWTETP